MAEVVHLRYAAVESEASVDEPSDELDETGPQPVKVSPALGALIVVAFLGMVAFIMKYGENEWGFDPSRVHRTTVLSHSGGKWHAKSGWSTQPTGFEGSKIMHPELRAKPAPPAKPPAAPASDDEGN